ncbi:MAG: metalloregulator ArsR/SmtB family transcription factor [Bacteroidales bacterium]|nr:metalloregulator ArsR/SmtB family transcription factor [Bacteroidales bacterium]
MKKSFKISPEKLETAATMLKAMAHPMRVAILNLLNNETRLTVSEIHTTLGIEQSTTSHHLGILKDKGVLKSERKGKNSYYFLKNKNLEHIIECLNKCVGCE